MSAVSLNDIMAYFFGVFFGRTPLIKLSPKKTWEGFCGGLFGTFVVSFFFSRYLSNLMFMTCPVEKFSISLFQQYECEIHQVYLPQQYDLNLGPFGHQTHFIAPVQFHALVIALFASLIAPFGGFLASGFKRAFKIKDFADRIPGHGGFTDRLDCKIMMGMFVQLYLT